MKGRRAVFLVLLAVAVVGCGGGGTREAVRLNGEFVAVTERYIEDLEKADTAPEVAAAMNRYADGMEVLMPRMRAFADAHPELRDPANQPDELKAAQRESEAVARRMMGVFMKAGRYLKDPEVRAAQERIARVMVE